MNLLTFPSAGNSTSTTLAPTPDTKEHPNFETENIVGLVIWFLCVLYSSITTSNSGSASKLTGTDRVLLNNNDGGSGDVEAGPARDNEQEEVGRVRETVFKSHVSLYVCRSLTPGRCFT